MTLRKVSLRLDLGIEDVFDAQQHRHGQAALLDLFGHPWRLTFGPGRRRRGDNDIAFLADGKISRTPWSIP